jgi:hypothetical protein
MSDQIFIYQGSNGRIELEMSPSHFLVRPVGVIDDHSDFSVLLWAVKKLSKVSPQVIFDLASITSITAEGVILWSKVSEQLSKSTTLIYRNIKECFLEAVNSNPKILGANSRAESFEAPYFCAQCKKEAYITLTEQEVRTQNGSFRAPEKTCSTCSSSQKFSWLEADYFNFLHFWDRAKIAIDPSG